MAITLDIFGAALFQRSRTETVLELAATGELPATIVDSNWVFLEEDLLNYLRSKIARETEERRKAEANASPTGKGRLRKRPPDLTTNLVKVPGF